MQNDADDVRERRAEILDELEVLASDFVYNDRKDDEDLPRGEIEAAVRAGEITVDEMIAHFGACLRVVLTLDVDQPTGGA